jgi:hypothetical protein
MKRLLTLFLIFISLFAGNMELAAQATEADSASLEAYKQQCRQLVRFLEYITNTVGDPQTSAREKDIIINQSYLKIFRDAEVQIEDDLEEFRATVTNKDVQAYLKDVDFFFKSVRFEFLIQEITHELTEAGDLYFKVFLSRSLQGITVQDDSLNTVQDRYIELNVDLESKVLKIVSIYTTKLSEKEELTSWWNGLSPEWKNVFAHDVRVNDSLTMKEVLAHWPLLELGDTLLMERILPEGDSLRTNLSMLFEEPEIQKTIDTLILNNEQIYQDLRRIMLSEVLEIDGHAEIKDLAPLSYLNRLRRLNISGTQVFDLTPIRNLTHLEVLDCSRTGISSLAPLRYATSLKTILAHHTFLDQLEPLQHFRELEKLDASYTSLHSIQALQGLPKLRELELASTRVHSLEPLRESSSLELLKISGSPIEDLSPLAGLVFLSVVNINYTAVSDLSPLAETPALTLLFCEGTRVSGLAPLARLGKLRKVYCDLTPVSRVEASRLMMLNPTVLVLYESAILQSWWQDLPAVWKSVFSEKMAWQNEKPDREALHSLVNLSSLDISGNYEIRSLEPLQQFTQLSYLDCANTDISDLLPLRDLVELKNLNFSGTTVADLEPIGQLRKLTELDLSQTEVSSLNILSGFNNLRIIRMKGTLVNDVLVLASLDQLERVYADESKVDSQRARQLLNLSPNLMLVFRSAELKTWWAGLGEAWQQVFRTNSKIDLQPTDEQLHLLTVQEELVIDGDDIDSLNALGVFLRLKNIQLQNTRVTDLSPLLIHTGLEALDCSRSPIGDLTPLRNLSNLRSLNIQNTPVSDLTPLAQLPLLESLNCSGTPVRNLKALASSKQLKKLDCSSTDVGNIRPLESIEGLLQLICYNTRLNERKVANFKASKPECEVVFY